MILLIINCLCYYVIVEIVDLYEFIKSKIFKVFWIKIVKVFWIGVIKGYDKGLNKRWWYRGS